jgi:hypothetical protein
MNSIINHIPIYLKSWAEKLTDENIAHILTMAGSAYISSNDFKLLDKTEVLSSANIGLKGEQEIYQMLQERFSIVNTSKSGKRGDFIICVNNIKILIEVKKYSKTVPSQDIEKFYRDIDSNTSIGGAIMISLTSKIVGISKTMEYTHQYVNGDNVPVIFLTLKDIYDKMVAKECVFSAVDILLAESDSKNKSIDIGEGISYAVNDIDKNLDFLSQCRLMIHETQSMFNKQLGKLMQQVLSAEINIKNSIKVLKSKVDINILECNTQSVKVVLSNLKVELDIDKYNLLSKVLDGQSVVLKTKNIIQTNDKKVSIAISKSTINVSISVKLSESLNIDEEWSYNGKAVTIALTEKTLQTILDIQTFR